MYLLIGVMQSKSIERLDNIFHNLSEKEHEIFMEILQKEKLLGGSKGNVVFH